ncbi:hypothetical protein HA402_015586 [Bradysia odoriphaga]|nr:hypothetical protein HA402_015586 [Bradysia odoriphaga]
MANTVLLESRSYRPFKSSEEYLYAMREDLAEWLNLMYPELRITTDNFMDRLDTGVALCKHANHVRTAAEEYLVRRQARNKSMTKSMTTGLAGPILAIGNIHYLPAAKSGTFFARDNVSNFISWCRKSLQIFECLLFETDDLIMRKNEKHVILCLLEVARRGAKFGMLAPMLVQMERQIDREIAADNRANGIGCGTQTENGSNTTSTGTDLFESDTDDEDDQNEPVLMYGPQPQIITNDLKSLDEMVRDLVEKCTCPSQFPMVRVSEGKYRIGDTKVLIFVRILRSHVMVRVGGGWDTLSHYLDKHDPCRCRASHRSSVAARLITRTNQATNGIELHKAQVFYERSPPVTRKLNNTSGNNTTNTNTLATLSPPSRARSRSRSPSARKQINNGHTAGETLQLQDKQQLTSPHLARRSMSPSPRRLNEFKKKQTSLDSAVCPTAVVSQLEPITTAEVTTESKTEQTNGDGVENISDNGSEISDEGYRSLGVIQANLNGNLKRSSLHSQTSEEPELNGRQEQTSSDSQLTPTDDQISNKTDAIESNLDTCDASHTQPKTFEQSGVFITDEDITIDISTTTGLRKTGFSANLYGDDGTPKATTKIPRSPMLVRRKSDLCSEIVTGLPVNSMRKSPVYRSVRKPTVSKETTPVAPPSKMTSPKNINTWNGRSTSKNRPAVANDTFQTPAQNSSFNRNSSSRTSQNMYDKNGRRIKSTNSSPTKTTTSPLAQQILEAAGNAKNDSQMLEKMKALLSKYTKVNGNGKEYDDDDFTTAWVNSNGTLDRATTNFSPSPTKMQSKRSSAASSIDSNHSKDTSASIITTRRDRGVSRIPAPIRQNTELY